VQVGYGLGRPRFMPPFPLTRLAPVLATVDAVRTAKLPAGPRPSGAAAIAAGWAAMNTARVPTATGHAASQ
jgi:hypothetical protein